MNEEPTLRVGSWTVHSSQNLLEHDGRLLKLEPRAMELLIYLAQRQGKVVSAEELMAGVWRGRIVEDSAIYKRINELRKAFDDDVRHPRFIETIPKRGYRLIAPVVRSTAGVVPVEVVPGDPRSAVAAPAQQPTAADSRRALVPGIASRPARAAIALAIAAVVLSFLVRQMVPARDAPVATSPDLVETRGALTNRPLTTDGGLKLNPRLSPNGELVAFAWDGGVTGANFDVYVKGIRSEARPVNVTSHPAVDGVPTWSPDGTELAFVRDEDGRLSIHIVSWPAGRTRRVGDIAGVAEYGHHGIPTLSWSPDGRFLAYAEKPGVDSPARIMRLDLKTGEKRALTMPVGNVIGDFEPSYSPNGGEIAFVRAPASYSTLDIWIMDRDGNGARRMTAGRWAYVHGLAWTPQRNELVFTAGDLYSRRSYAVNAGGGTAYPLSGLGENDRFAHVQAGRTVYARYINPPLRIWRLPRDDAGAQAQYFGIEGAKLAFSPDGERVAYMRGSGDGHAQIWTARSDGSDQQALVDVRSDAFNPYWSADGSQLLFNSLDSGNWDAYLLDIESGRVRQITKHPADDYYPRFSRDQQWIYISSNRSGRYEVYRMAAAGDDAAPVPITRGGGIDGVESHDGEYVYYESTRNADPSLSGNASIWRVATHGDDNGTEVLNGWGLRIERSWALAESGIYFLVNGPDFVIRHLNLATKQLSDVYRGSGRALYPAVPPDEKSLFVSIESPETSELWLVDDYAP